jgi:hypothetical protein
VLAADAIFMALPHSSPPHARQPGALGDQITDLRGIILHMMEEIGPADVSAFRPNAGRS